MSSELDFSFDAIEPVPTVASKYPEYANLVKKLNHEPASLSNWDKLFSYLDTILEMNHKDDDPVYDLIKSSMESLYYALLYKFPYLVDYWKSFVTLQYQFGGMNRCFQTLQKSLELFPNSIDLWMDFINIIISNNLHNNDDQFVRNLYEKLVSNCGLHFLSHPIWDSYLEWELSKNGENSIEYLNILLRVIRIPLHQYAKYSEKFLAIKNNFKIEELMSNESSETVSLPDNIDDLSLEEHIEISDNYFNKVIASTYDKTTERWKFEQNIQTIQFTISPVPETELVNWSEYLEFIEKTNDDSLIVALYERCLVPCAMYEQFWIKYLKYLIRRGATDGTTALEITLVFEKGIRNVPSNFVKLRLMYINYLISISNEDSTNKQKSYEILISILKLNNYKSSLENEKLVYKILLELLSSEPGFDDDLELFLSVSFVDLNQEDDAGKKKKRKLSLETSATTSNNATSIADIKEILTATLKNDTFKQAILLLDNYERLNRLIINDKVAKLNYTKVKRDFFLKFISKNSIARDFDFLFSFISFEISQRNDKNLRNLLTYLLNYSELPPHQYRFLIRQILEFLDKNDATFSNLSEANKIMLEISPDSSFNYRKFSRQRNQLSDSWLLRQNGHPGIETELKPMVTNRMNFFDSYATTTPLLPMYKNVEKANLLIKYPKSEEPSI